MLDHVPDHKKEITYLDVSSVVPYVNNARTHSEQQVAQIAASIREFGFTNPILTDGEGGIIAGHGRLLAAQKLGLKQIPALVLDYLTESQKKALVIADNKLALNAGWDTELLKVELESLGEMGFDLSLTGFAEDELALFFNDGTQGLTDPDEVPDEPITPISIEGDVWILGKHRLVCGDCTDADVVGKALNGVVPHLMVTDPPYGVEYDATWRAEAGVNKNKKKMGAVQNDSIADWREAWSLFPGDVVYVWHADKMAVPVAESLDVCGFEIKAQIIWAKDRMALSRGHYHWQHEPCWYAVRKNKTGHWSGDRKQTTLWSIKAREDGGHGHSTQKPVECMRRPIENNSSPGQSVYEPFSGSGTTIIACEQTGRSCHAIELNPAYVDMAVIRWQNFTGIKAVHADSGVEFDGTKAA